MTIGLVVNPVAGVGGPAGLWGSDGAETQRTAIERGSVARAGERAAAALAALPPGTEVLTAAGPMGEESVLRAGLVPRVVRPAGAADRESTATTADDTRRAVAALAGAGAGLVLFAGGDGTARDVVAGLSRWVEEARQGRLETSRRDVAILGIPAGVKMYSSCFAVGPGAAGAIAARWLHDGGLPTTESEVLDLDEALLREGRAEPRLFGLAKVPFLAGRTQARKAATPASEAAAVHAAVAGAARELLPGIRYLLGPGGTMAALARQLGVDASPLGVDVVLDGRLIVRDGSEREILDAIDGQSARAVVTVIGGQGFLLGRGNQQLSARVIRALADDPLLVVATEQKLTELEGRPLLVDTGDAGIDARLAGYVRVVTGPSISSIYPVRAPEAEGACACV